VTEEAWARLSPTDQANVARIAARFGWSGFELTAWLLMNELDGYTAEDVLAATSMVHELMAGPYHRRQVLHAYGMAYTVATLPHDPAGDNRELWLPPVPGKATWTVVRSEPPALDVAER
jgi:hypothetical protein